MSKLRPTCVGQSEHLGGPATLAGTRNTNDFGVAIGHDVVEVAAYAGRAQPEFFTNVRGAYRSMTQHMEQDAVSSIVIAHLSGHLISFSFSVVPCSHYGHS